MKRRDKLEAVAFVALVLVVTTLCVVAAFSAVGVIG